MKKFEDLKAWKKKALYMSTYKGLCGAEIARVLNVPERTVQDNLKKLKGRFDIKDIQAFSESGELVEKPKAKILFHDIETSLAVSYHFGQWQQNLGIKQQIFESHMLSHAWAWNDDDVQGSILTRDEVLARDEQRIVLEVWTLLDECDIYVAHNGKAFDVKKLNGYFLKFGLPPPSPFKVVDTLQIAKRKFNIPFKSLAYLAKFLNVTRKIDNSGMELWVDCALGKQEALDEMMDYNFGDIVTLREIYYKLIGWDNDAVNMSLYEDVEGLVCPHCASQDVSRLKGKFAYTAQRKYNVYRCGKCSANLRGSAITGEDKKLYRIV